MQKPIIKEIQAKKLVGIKTETSWTQDKTSELWRLFMPQKSKIVAKNTDLISLQIYPADFDFRPTTAFEKWALAEVENFAQIPEGMERFTLEAGLYAIFHYKGSSSDTSIFQYIYGEWLPNSAYKLDHRPHFEVLGEKYKNNDPNSEEDIYIPIKPKI